jgi:hypothetical protein
LLEMTLSKHNELENQMTIKKTNLWIFNIYDIMKLREAKVKTC